MTTIARNIESPDEKFELGRAEMRVVNLEGLSLVRATMQPGWRWSTDIKPSAGTGSCQLGHAGVILSGRFHVEMDDGRSLDLGPGDVHVVPPGHDAWVVGDEPVVVLDVKPGAARGGRLALCPCGVEFRISEDRQLDHLIAAVQEHALGSHGHDVSREHVLSELSTL